MCFTPIKLVSLFVLFVFGSVAINSKTEAQQCSMLRVVSDTAVIYTIENGHKRNLGEVASGVTLWSLEKNNGLNRVVEPLTGRVGWIKQSHVSPVIYTAKQQIKLKRAADLHRKASKNLEEAGARFKKKIDIRLKSRELFEESLKLRSDVLVADHPLIAESKLGLAMAIERGAAGNRSAEIAEAEKLGQESLDIIEARYGAAHEGTLVTVEKLLMIRPKLEWRKREFEILQAKLGLEHSSTLGSLRQLASAMEYVEALSDVTSVYELAIETHQRVLGGKAIETNELRSSFALYLLENDQSDTAFDIIRDYLRFAAADDLIVVDIHETVQRKENYSYAESVYQDLANACGEVVGVNSELAAESEWYLGKFYIYQTKEYLKALPHIERAFHGYERLGVKGKNNVANQAYCQLLIWAGKLDEAKKLIGTNKAHRCLPHLLVRSENHDQATELFDSLARAKFLAQPSYLRMAMPSLERQLSYGISYSEEEKLRLMSAEWLFNRSSWEPRRLFATTTPENKTLLKRLVEARKMVSHYTQKVEPGKYNEVSKKLSDAELQLRLVEEELKTGLPARRKESDWISTKRLQAKLKPNQAYVEFVQVPFTDFRQKDSVFENTNQVYAAWIITQDKVTAFNLGSASVINEQIESLRKQIVSSVSESPQNSDSELALATKALSSSVYDPIGITIPPQINELIIKPDAGLWHVPWAGLNDSNGKWVIEKFSVRLVADCRRLFESNEKIDTSGSAEIFGCPDFSKVMDVSWQATPFPSLPGSAVEAQAIVRSIEDSSLAQETNLHLGAAALESKFKALVRPEFIAFSTHGFIPNAGSHYADARSGLVLSGDGNPNEFSRTKEDGILTAQEILSSDLRGTKLVVLSACQTGVTYTSGLYQISSLRDSFRRAGAESVLATLWQVEDQETARLMDLFFKKYAAGMTKSEALRNAQLSRIKARRARHGDAHPFFWAGFTLTGQD